jgi:hypothetical protein
MSFTLPALIVVATMPALLQSAENAQQVVPRGSAVERRAPLPRKDSIRVLKVARRAQSDFEEVRRELLPRQSGLSGRTCDVVIGKYCHWQMQGSGPPPEAARVITGREQLLTVLDSLGRLVPGDQWIIAQKVRYLMEAGRPEEAEAMAVQCAAQAGVSATRRWCRALAGYTAQERGDYAHADSAFAAAFAEMPESERCDWQDLTLLLDGKAKGEYKKLSCAARDSMATALWRLVQPLYLTGVNDLRTEFLARVTRMHIEQNSRTPMRYSQGADDRETLLRYGGGLWYTQDIPPAGSGRSSTVASHRRGPAFNFFPQSRALAALEQLRLDDWEFSGLAPRTHYAPEYAKRFLRLLDHQLAVFRRGDSALIVAAFDLTDEVAIGGGHLEAGLFAAALERGGVAPPLGTSIANPGPTNISTMRAPWRPMIVSLEVLDRENRTAERARYSVRLPPPGARLSLSDLLLYTPRDTTPVALTEAMPLALRALRVPRSRRLGLFWEAYGVRPKGEAFEYALLVEPIGQSWIRRTFIKLKLKEKDAALSLQWKEVPAAADGIASRALTVDLSPLKPGRYRVRLSLTPTGDLPILAERELDIMQ